METTPTIFADFWAYLRRPQYVQPLANTPGRNSFGTALRCFGAEYPLFISLALLSFVAVWQMQAVTDSFVYERLAARKPFPSTVVAALVLSAILIEAFFRGMLRLTPRRIGWFIFLTTVALSGSILKPIEHAFGLSTGAGVIPGGLLLGGVLSWFAKRPTTYSRIERIWQNHFSWVFYGSALLYTTWYVGNLSALTDWYLLLAPGLLLISFLISTYLGYVRMKYGFWFAVAIQVLLVSLPAGVQLIRLLSI